MVRRKLSPSGTCLASKEEAIKLLTNLVVPCRHFQLKLEAGYSIPLGFCWAKRSEISFGGRCCADCQKFSCGLFDPMLVSTGELDTTKVSSSYAVIVRKMKKHGHGPDRSGWIIWQGFRERVLHWRKSLLGNRIGRYSRTTEVLLERASDLELAKFGLPEALENETIFDYYARVCPRKYNRLPGTIKGITKTFKVALQNFLDGEEIGLGAASVVAKANELMGASATPDGS